MLNRILVLTCALMLSASATAFSQSNPTDRSTTGNPSGSVEQPQGQTGPINTKSTGGAPTSEPARRNPAGHAECSERLRQEKSN